MNFGNNHVQKKHMNDDEEEEDGEIVPVVTRTITYPNYGQAQVTDKTSSFPKIGSTLGPWFCLGTLGKGTFSSIHKVIKLDYFHNNNNNNSNKNRNYHGRSPSRKRQRRVAAAKVELSDFANSGVLLGEAVLLHFLDDTTTRPTTTTCSASNNKSSNTNVDDNDNDNDRSIVPVYLGHYKQCAVPPGTTSTTSDSRAKSNSSNGDRKDDNNMGSDNPSGTNTNNNEAAQVPQNPTAGLPPGAAHAALVMEYLSGDDMHMIRELYGVGPTKRRLAVRDAVHLTAQVLLPLLQSMHNVGLVHRDVKPSNVVRVSNTSRNFLLVDFGLSKSLVVPSDSTTANPKYPWRHKQWLRPLGYTTTTTAKENEVVYDGSIRHERPQADFRGTSMYASLRVHQGRDYARRDDLWSLLYVFCDLVSGGLPWMSHAANRDREACQYIKETVHGLRPSNSSNQDNQNDSAPPQHDKTELLLMGDEYHIAKFKYDKMGGANAPNDIRLPQPLPLCKDPRKVDLLRRAFDHLSKLSFYDEPNYDLIQDCLNGFLNYAQTIDDYPDPPYAPVRQIDWDKLCQPPPVISSRKRRKKQRSSTSSRRRNSYNSSNASDNDDDKNEEDTVPVWKHLADPDPLDEHYADIFDNVKGESSSAATSDLIDIDMMDDPHTATASPTNYIYESILDSNGGFERLPLEMKFHIIQMEYHLQYQQNVPKHILLRDFMKLATILLYEEWDTKKYEFGGHRKNSDNYRREFYVECCNLCLEYAKRCDQFSHPDYYYNSSSNDSASAISNGNQDNKYHNDNNNNNTTNNIHSHKKNGEHGNNNNRKRATNNNTSTTTTIQCHFPAGTPNDTKDNRPLSIDLISISRVLFGLKNIVRSERTKSFAPPPLLSFGTRR